MDEWIDTEEAEELTSYRADYLRKLARQRVIKSKKVGFSVMIEKESLMKYKTKQDERKELRASQ